MSQASSWIEQAHKNAGWLVALGVMEIILGVIVLLSPLASGLAMTIVIGVVLLIGGVVRLFAAFGADSFGSGALGFIWGLLVAASGFYIVINPGLGLASLTLVLGVMFFVGGMTQVVIAFQMKPTSGWGWMLFGGIVTVLLAFMTWWQFPISALWLVGTLVGIHLMGAGIGTIAIGSAARKLSASD